MAVFGAVFAAWSLGTTSTLLIAVVFAGVGLFVGGAVFGKRRSAKQKDTSDPSPEQMSAMYAPLPETPPAPASVYAPPASDEASNHRSTVRTSGTWVKVVLTEEHVGGRLLEAHVVDHTPNGVGIVAFEPLPVGQVFKIRHAKAPGDVPWVSLEVRSCQQLEKNVWKAGCYVEDVTLWDTLMRYS